MKSVLVLNAKIVNEGSCSESDLLARNGRIERIGPDLSSLVADEVIDASGLHLIPGLIDDQADGPLGLGRALGLWAKGPNAERAKRRA
mgnify:CR=1 FL=1